MMHATVRASRLPKPIVHSRTLMLTTGLPLVAFLALSSGAAWAQSTSNSADAASTGTAPERTTSDGSGNPDIIVNARRREERAQDVPISITAITDQALKNNNAVSLQDIQYLVPSLAVTTGNVGQRESANVSIRGQGYGSIVGQPAVALYINEVALPTDFDGSQAGGPGLFFDIENVQVLKGPQGTLFGRNTMGGAVLVQTARPKDDFGGRLQVGYGNYDNREIEGVLNLPILQDKIAFRIAGTAQKRDGITRVLATPEHPNGFDLDNRNFYAVRGTLELTPNDVFTNVSSLSYLRFKSHGSANFLVDIEPNGFAASLYADANPTIVELLAQQRALGKRVHIPIGNELSDSGGSLLAFENISTAKLSDEISLRNIFGYRYAIADYRADLDGTQYALFDVVSQRYPSRTVSDELQLVGTGLDGRLNWIVGGYYSFQRPPGDNRAPRLALRVVLPADAPADLINVDTTRRLELTNKAVFAQATYEVVENLRLTLGGRYTWDTRGGGSIDSETGELSLNEEQNSKAFTYTAGIDYRFSPDVLAYFTTRRGYRAGGSTGASNGDEFPFGPEYVTDYELGLKADWNIGGVSLRTNAAVYYQDYDKIQVNQLIDFPGEPAGLNVVTNAGVATLKGAELEVLAVLTPRLRIGGNLSLLDFDFGKIAEGVDEAAILQTEDANRIPFKYSLNAEYDIPVPESVGKITVGANYSWQDKFGDFLGSSVIPSYGIANAYVNLRDIAGSPFYAQLFVQNLTDKTYESGGIGFLGFTERTYGDPRLYGLRVGYRFGSER